MKKFFNKLEELVEFIKENFDVERWLDYCTIRIHYWSEDYGDYYEDEKIQDIIGIDKKGNFYLRYDKILHIENCNLIKDII